jgi:O-antigen/teichoic acid export membrane protein
LTVGVFINGLAQVPCAQVQAAGRPDLTAKINIAEVPVYLFLLWFLAQRLGIVGAAMAWTCRVSVDCLLMFVAARKLLPASRAGVRRILGGCATAIGLLALGAVPMPLSLTLIFLIAIGVVFGIATWRLFLTASEKALVWQLRRLWLASD